MRERTNSNGTMKKHTSSVQSIVSGTFKYARSEKPFMAGKEQSRLERISASLSNPFWIPTAQAYTLEIISENDKDRFVTRSAANAQHIGDVALRPGRGPLFIMKDSVPYTARGLFGVCNALYLLLTQDAHWQRIQKDMQALREFDARATLQTKSPYELLPMLAHIGINQTIAIMNPTERQTLIESKLDLLREKQKAHPTISLGPLEYFTHLYYGTQPAFTNEHFQYNSHCEDSKLFKTELQRLIRFLQT